MHGCELQPSSRLGDVWLPDLDTKLIVCVEVAYRPCIHGIQGTSQCIDASLLRLGESMGDMNAAKTDGLLTNLLLRSSASVDRF
jgi:hypothetical protein